MNKHINPPENIREVPGWVTTAPTRNEQFLMLAGNKEPFVFGDLMSRAEVTEEVGEHYAVLAKIIAFDLGTGTCRDATDEITSIVIARWAEDDVALNEKQKAFVAMCKGEAFANCFRLEEA